jgi:hypothetical protein
VSVTVAKVVVDVMMVEVLAVSTIMGSFVMVICSTQVWVRPSPAPKVTSSTCTSAVESKAPHQGIDTGRQAGRAAIGDRTTRTVRREGTRAGVSGSVWPDQGGDINVRCAVARFADSFGKRARVRGSNVNDGTGRGNLLVSIEWKLKRHTPSRIPALHWAAARPAAENKRA